MSNIKISFCIPVYNVEKYLNSCIDSIEAQELNNNEYEIICIDDCSTDNSYNILLERANINSNIRVLKNKKNGGIAYTRNRLIDEAKGNYIWFIDSDDMITLNSAKLLLEIGINNNYDYLSGYYIKKSDLFNEFNLYDVRDNINSLKITDCLYQGYEVWIGIIKRELLIHNNLYFNEKLKYAEDLFFTYELKELKPKSGQVNANIYIYRTSHNSITRGKNIYKIYESTKILYSLFKEKLNNVEENEILLKRKQEIMLKLVRIEDNDFIKKELQSLKKQGIYPYKLRKAAFKDKISFARRCLAYVLPIEFAFWLYHYSLMFYFKIRKFKND